MKSRTIMSMQHILNPGGLKDLKDNSGLLQCGILSKDLIIIYIGYDNIVLTIVITEIFEYGKIAATKSSWARNTGLVVNMAVGMPDYLNYFFWRQKKHL